MAMQTEAVKVTIPIERLARLVRALDQEQKMRLLQLVPELQTLQATTDRVAFGQEALLAYFDHQLEALPQRRSMQDDDPFVGGFTVAEFFALSEKEQARIWNDAHANAERELGLREAPVRPDALPAR